MIHTDIHAPPGNNAKRCPKSLRQLH